MLSATPALSELYVYRDAQGVLHVTNIPVGEPWKPYDAIEDYFEKAASLYDLDAALLRAIARAESNFDPRAVSPKGALGLMQLMPETARAYGVKDPFDPEENVLGAAAYLRDLILEFKDIRLALAAYNAGPERVRSYRGVPPFSETMLYLERVFRFWRLYRTQKNFRILTKNP
ncbi:MAG: lytic transglycosylase domain-containing protein [Thermodesulfobacteria bacterium]|nr:lytic transglycosylase domain-containing protein [Thermodesulfobacteriota bacterium]